MRAHKDSLSDRAKAISIENHQKDITEPDSQADSGSAVATRR